MIRLEMTYEEGVGYHIQEMTQEDPMNAPVNEAHNAVAYIKQFNGLIIQSKNMVLASYQQALAGQQANTGHGVGTVVNRPSSPTVPTPGSPPPTPDPFGRAMRGIGKP